MDILLVALAIVLIISSIFKEISDFIESFEKIPERVCDIKGDSVVKLGEHKFRIPSTLRGAYINRNGPSAVHTKRRQEPYMKICPTGPNSEFVRSQFLIYAPIRSELTDTHLPFAATITVSISKRTPRADLFEGRKISKNRDWEPSGDFQTRIRIFTGIGGGGAWRTRLFVTKDEEFVTPRGNLVAFQCPVGGSKKRWFRRCSTFFAWSDDLRVSYAFNDQDYPIEEWRTLHGQVVDYINSIKLTVDPELSNSTNRQ